MGGRYGGGQGRNRDHHQKWAQGGMRGNHHPMGPGGWHGPPPPWGPGHRGPPPDYYGPREPYWPGPGGYHPDDAWGIHGPPPPGHPMLDHSPMMSGLSGHHLEPDLPLIDIGDTRRIMGSTDEPPEGLEPGPPGIKTASGTTAGATEDSAAGGGGRPW